MLKEYTLKNIICKYQIVCSCSGSGLLPAINFMDKSELQIKIYYRLIKIPQVNLIFLFWMTKHRSIHVYIAHKYLSDG